MQNKRPSHRRRSKVGCLDLVCKLSPRFVTQTPHHFSAMRSLDSELRWEYDQAAEAAPHLVISETPFMDFLRTEQMNAHLAARRLVLYWKYRKKVFKERWLFPMTQTGSGCLNQNDIAILRTGVLVALQRNNQGPLLLCDLSRVETTLGATAVRVAFYLASTCANGLAQTLGVTVLQVVTSAHRPPVETDPENWQMILTGLPLRFGRVLVVQSVEEGRERLIESLAYQQTRATEFCAGFVTEMISSSTVEGLLQQLTERGISPEHVPTTLGGRYHYQRFMAWIQRRTAAEQENVKAPATPPSRNILPAVPVAFLTAPPAVARAMSRESSSEAAAVSSSGEEVVYRVSTSSDDADFRRQRNAMYVRRFYRRQTLATESLQEQSRVLKERNTALRETNARLTQLLEEVRRLVAAHAGRKDG